MVGLISNIRTLGAPKLAGHLPDHLAIVKALLDEIDQTMTFDQDAFPARVIAFYVTSRDALRVQLKNQITDETAHLENTSWEMSS